MGQNLSAPGAVFLRTEEGFVPKWYADVGGIGTLGIGFTWGSDSFREWWQRNRPGQTFGPNATMTRGEAEQCLIFICALEYAPAVVRLFGRDVPQHVFDGTLSPAYNMGVGALAWQWAQELAAGHVGQAVALLAKTGTTAKNTGKVIKGLQDRRREEGELIAKADYTIGIALDPLADGLLVRGERGAPVIDLQRDLTRNGFYAGKIDGIFGYGTEAAVLAFQRARKLGADGVAGPKTLAMLEAA